MVRMPDSSYSVRSAFSTNSSASLSLLKRGSFFFIVLHFLLVHAPGANRPNESFAAPRPKREHDENSATLTRPADCLEALLGFRVQRIRKNGDWPAEYVLDRRRRNAVLLALGPVALIPVKSGYLDPGLSRRTLVKCAFLYSHSSISPAVRIPGERTRSAPNGGQPHATISRDESSSSWARKDFWRCSRDLRHYVHEVACVAGAATVGAARG